MKILIIGASGFVGGAIAKYFSSIGHKVIGHYRSENNLKKIEFEKFGIIPFKAELTEDIQLLFNQIKLVDVVIFAAQVKPSDEVYIVKSILEEMKGTNKKFIFISGTGVSLQRTDGEWSQDSFAEDDLFIPEPLAIERLRAENIVKDFSNRNIHTIIVRPSTIWGTGEHGHLSKVYQSVGLTGSACYIGNGLATYSNVSINDVVKLFEILLTKGNSGKIYHAVGGEIPNRWIAEAVANDLGCSVKSINMEEAINIWGEFGALIMSASNRSRCPKSRDQLGWVPNDVDMLSMIGNKELRKLATV